MYHYNPCSVFPSLVLCPTRLRSLPTNLILARSSEILTDHLRTDHPYFGNLAVVITKHLALYGEVPVTLQMLIFNPSVNLQALPLIPNLSDRASRALYPL